MNPNNKHSYPLKYSYFNKQLQQGQWEQLEKV